MRYILLFFFSALSFAQQTTKVDFKTLQASLKPKAVDKSISGNVSYQFEVKSAIDTIRIDAKNMIFNEVTINSKPVQFKNNNKELLLFEGFKTGKNTLSFSYKATPKQTLYFIGEGDDLQIWTQGQGKYTSHWLPSFDDVNEKVIFNLKVAFASDFSVLANGKLKNSSINNNLKTWEYTMKEPMSSYLAMLAIGKFINQQQVAKSGTVLEFYLDRNDADKFEPTYRYSKQIFDYFETEIGVKYPWKVYRQVPVRDFLYAGMENTTSTIFAQDLVVDVIGFNDRNYVNVNAHELAHQWFGDLVTAKSGKHHWLQEGFATYYALLAERQVFGEDYFYYQLYKSALQLRNAAKTDTIPVMNEKASSLSFYQKGAWALHVIRESIGEKSFAKAVKTYLKTYQFKNVETNDFLAEIKKVSNFDTETFKKTWLEDGSFQYDVAIQMLARKNVFIRDYLKIRSQKDINEAHFNEVIDEYRMLLQSDAYAPIKQEIVFKISKLNYKSNKDLVEMAINSNDYKVRQAVADYFPKVPLYLKSKYETLLDDPSYTTREVAFANLWSSFPEEQENYLNKAKNWVGNNDKGLRILYLSYVQFSKVLDINARQNLYSELLDYTSPKYESSIRQNAIEAVLLLNKKEEIMLKNLVNATTHFKWQFSKYAKDKIKDLARSSEIHLLFEKMMSELNPVEQSQLKKLL
ncbi:MAG: M1 family metallopeptidase [Bacteroidota bacterium]